MFTYDKNENRLRIKSIFNSGYIDDINLDFYFADFKNDRDYFRFK